MPSTISHAALTSQMVVAIERIVSSPCLSEYPRSTLCKQVFLSCSVVFAAQNGVQTGCRSLAPQLLRSKCTNAIEQGGSDGRERRGS